MAEERGVDRTLRAGLGLLLGSILLACSVGGSLEECVGTFSGTYTGESEGWVTATMDFERTLNMAFADGANERKIRPMLMETGHFDLSTGPFQVQGRFDFQTCTATGTWATGTGDLTGTFMIEAD